MAFVAGLIVRRIVNALAATFRLLRDVEVLGRLPWSYLRRLPLRNLWIGILTMTLPLTFLASLAAFVIRGSAGAGLANLAWTAAVVGVLSSWLRWVVRRVSR